MFFRPDGIEVFFTGLMAELGENNCFLKGK